MMAQRVLRGASSLDAERFEEYLVEEVRVTRDARWESLALSMPLKVLSALAVGPCTMDALAVEVSVDAPAIEAALTKLAASGAVQIGQKVQLTKYGQLVLERMKARTSVES